MEIIENLKKLNFSHLEAQIYMALLGSTPMSAYQIAKKIDISRPSIYNALEHMQVKGMVEVVPNDTLLYIAQEPDVLLEKISMEMQTSLNNARKELEMYKEQKYDETYANFYGFNTLISKVKGILSKAESDIYINADFELLDVVEEMEVLSSKGINVIVFSFYEMKHKVSGIHYFSHNRDFKPDHTASRFMLAVDKSIAMMAGGGEDLESWKGTISDNKMFIKIVSEHIHNDIYLLKLRGKYGKEIYDKYLYLNTDFEKRNREKKYEDNSIRFSKY